MISIETLFLLSAFAAGVGAGVLFYGGLWRTVARAARSENPGLLFLGSFVARMAAALAVICYVGQGRLDRLAVCLLGFTLAKAVVTRRVAGKGSPRAYQSR